MRLGCVGDIHDGRLSHWTVPTPGLFKPSGADNVHRDAGYDLSVSVGAGYLLGAS